MNRPSLFTALGWAAIAVAAILATVMIFVVTAHAEPVPPQDYTVAVTKIVDGDSFDFALPADWPAFVKPEARIAGIDTPEHQRPAAQTLCEVALGVAATVFAKTILHPGDVVVIHWDGKTHEKYGRLIGTVTLPDHTDYGAAMIAHGSARAYGGGHKDPWCADPPRTPRKATQ